MRDMPSILARYRGEVEDEMRAVLGGRSLPLYDMVRYHLGWLDEHGRPSEFGAGKGLRPTLCLLACEAVGGDYRLALPAAAAIELAHNFSLIHDDIQDGDRERRHRPTVWAIWGLAQAINAGDSMHLLSGIALHRLTDRGVSAAKTLAVSRVLAEACIEMIEGQYLDLSFENRLDIGVDAYLEMSGKKTGAMIEASIHIGALLGTDDLETTDRLCRFGRKLGVAFQMQDDLLGIWGQHEKTGKPLGADIRRRKKTLPVVCAFERAEGADKENLLAIYRRPNVSDVDVDTVLAIFDKVGAREYTQAMGDSFRRQGVRLLERLTVAERSRRALGELADFLVAREY